MAYAFHAPRFHAPGIAALRLLDLRRAFTAWRVRGARHRSLADLPESLRKDVGLDGGVRLARFENGGRTFVVDNRCDAVLSGWFW